MFKKILAAAVVTMFLFGGLTSQNSADAASHWKGPKGSLPERPIYASSKIKAFKTSLKQKIIDLKIDFKFRKYKGYSSKNLK